MNQRIQELAIQAYELCSKRTYGTVHSQEEFNQKFAELIIRQCSSQCGSQADQRNILKSFGLEVESNIKYPSPERDGSVNSQYEREYNLPKG
jgi:hypothetical protein